MSWIDDAAKLIMSAGEAAAKPAARAARGGARASAKPPVDVSALKRPPTANRRHNQGPPIADPFEFVGQDVYNNLLGIPTAREIVGRDPLPIGSGYTGIKSQQSVALPQHYSRGFHSDTLLNPVNLDIADAKGSTLLGIVGDNSDRKFVTQVQDTVFPEPIATQGGFRYIDEGQQGYAGALGPTNSKANEALRSENPLYVTLKMGEQSPDFALPTGQIFGRMFEQAKIAKKDRAFVRDQIKSTGVSVKQPDGKSVTSYPFTDFEGVDDPSYLLRYIEALPTGSLRAAFLKGLDRAKLQSMGVPRVSDARLAMNDLDQVGMDWGTAGYRAFVPDLERGVYKTTPDQSVTYEAGIDKVGPSFTLSGDGRGIPAGLLFPDLAGELRARGSGGGLEMTSPAYKVFEGSPTRSKAVVDDKMIDIVSSFTEIEKSAGRGPALQFANTILSGVEVTGAMIEQARRLNAPKWVLAAMSAAAASQASQQPQGALSSEQY